jgi:hypothetical protein
MLNAVSGVVHAASIDRRLDRRPGAAVADLVIVEVLLGSPGPGLGELVGGIVGVTGGDAVFRANASVK